jgi:UDP-arabinose 4-epimerase
VKNNNHGGAVLVTGGAGYIGSHVCKALELAGFTPISYDNLVYGHRWAVRWGPLEVGDIADRFKLDEVIKRYSPIAVMHFAAYAYVGESMEDPGKYFRNNVAGTLTLLEAMRDHCINKFIFSSSCATYGIPDYTPVNENQPQRPISPYGASKLMVEDVLKYFDTAHRLRSISLRYFNAAGADKDGMIGEAHDPETHLIPLVMDAARGVRPAITIFGDDYDTPDGTCIRDYIHVSDLADAHVLALQALQAGATTTAYNLGNGQGFSVREVIAGIEKLAGHHVQFRIGPRRLGDPAILVGDATRIKSELCWIPQYDRLDSILKTAWDWKPPKEK